MSLDPDVLQQMTQSGLNLITQALSIYDKDLKLAVCNRRFKQMFSLPPEMTQIGANFDDTIRYLVKAGEYGLVDDIETFVQERVNTAREFTPHYFERQRPNGQTISIEGSPLRTGGWVAVYTDITEIKAQERLLRAHSDQLSDELLARSEELAQTNRTLRASVTALEEAKDALSVSEARLASTTAMVPAHIARLSCDGIYNYSNKNLPRILPGRPKEIVGLHLKQALGAEAYEKVAPYFERAIIGDECQFEFHLTSSARYIRVSFTPEYDPDGEVQGVYLLSQDITEETLARRSLTHTRRRELAAQLTSGLAHDFSNLLTIIKAQQNRLEQAGLSDPTAVSAIAAIKSAASRGEALLSGLSQIEQARDLKVEPVHLGGFIEEFAMLGRGALPAGIALEIRSDLRDRTLVFDRGFAQDALLNLVLNAKEAIGDIGKIEVELRQIGEVWLSFDVQDTGPGFSQLALENVFQPFFTTREGGTGRGLGLSTVFDFARLSGGRVHAENRQGAFVQMQIPFYPAAATGAEMILLVEDNPQIRESIRRDLRRLGPMVVECDNAEEALRLSEIPGLSHVLSDIKLAGQMTGVDLVKKLRSTQPALEIYLLTGLPKSNTLARQGAALCPVLQKPLVDGALAAVFSKNGSL